MKKKIVYEESSGNVFADLDIENPEFRKQLDPFHPSLAVFMAEAMKIFTDRDLS